MNLETRDARLQRWAYLKKRLRDAQRAVLDEEKESWASFKALQKDVEGDGWDGTVETEFGRAIFDRKPILLHTASHKIDERTTVQLMGNTE